MCVYSSYTNEIKFKFIDVVKEGIWLQNNGYSPYDGNSYHNSPLYLIVFNYVNNIPEIYMFIDIIASIFLYFSAIQFQKAFKNEIMEFSDEKKSSDQLDKPLFERDRIPFITAIIYLLNPFTIVTSVSLSTQSVENLLVITTIYSALSGNIIFTSIFCGICIYLSPYYITLIIPLALILSHIKERKLYYSLIPLSILIAATISLLLVGSFYYLNGDISNDMLMDFKNWKFLDATYGFVFKVEDLQPNIGIFWYYFTHLFDNFKAFFLFVFQYHVFIYVLPVSYRFQKYPFIALWILLAISCTLKSYPAVGDVALYISFLPIISHLLKELVYGYAISISIICTIILTPLMWNMWIWSGSANANFYYAMTLVSVLSQEFLILDVADSTLKLDYKNSLKKLKQD